MLNVGYVKIKYKITAGVRKTYIHLHLNLMIFSLKLFYVSVFLDMEEETFSCHTPFISDINSNS